MCPRPFWLAASLVLATACALAACSTSPPSIDETEGTQGNVVVFTAPRADIAVERQGSVAHPAETTRISTDVVMTTFDLEPGPFDVRVEDEAGVWTASAEVASHGTIAYHAVSRSGPAAPTRIEVDAGVDRTLPSGATVSLAGSHATGSQDAATVLGWRQDAGPPATIQNEERGSASAELGNVGTYRFAFGVSFGSQTIWDRVEIVVKDDRDGVPDEADAPIVAAGEGDFHVAVDGDDAAPGTIDRPFATIQRAIDAAGPGDAILVRGGVYAPREPIRIQDSGTPTARIYLAAFPGEGVTIDGSGFTKDAGLISLKASYWTIADIEIRNGSYSGVLLREAHHNELIRLDVHHNASTGVHLDEDTTGNLIVDTASHHNYDVATGGTHADGFGVKHRTSTGNTFLRTRAYHNSDDGFDLLESGPQAIHRSVAYRNGFRDSGLTYPDGDGNGFKLGIGASDRWQSGGGHLVTRSVAWGNLYTGFTSNDGTVPITLVHNTAFENGRYNYFFGDVAHVLRNNLSVGSTDDVKSVVTAESNSWQLDLDDPGFQSLDPASTEFLRLAEQSDAVDAGTVLDGMAFAGEGPDLGAFEFGMTADFPAGFASARLTSETAR